MKDSYFDMTDKELYAISEGAEGYSAEEIEFAKDILIKRESFRKFPNQQLRDCMKLDMYTDVDRKVMEKIIGERSHKPKPSHVSLSGIETKDTETSQDRGWTYADIQEIKRNVNTIKACAIFFVVLTVLSLILGFVSFTQIAENISKLF